MAKTDTGLLDGKQAICDYLGISDYKFGRFIAKGMPARFEDGRWYAHKENLEAYFQVYTRHQERKDREEEADE